MKIELEITELGEYLYYVMNRDKVGVREVAKEIGSSAATVSRICRGEDFNIRLIKPISEYLKLTPEKLYELLPEPIKFKGS